MKTFKIVYYDPETDKYVHQSIKCELYYISTNIVEFFSDGTPGKLVLALNINNFISIEQVN